MDFEVLQIWSLMIIADSMEEVIPPFFEAGCNIPEGPEHGVPSDERDVIMGHTVLGRPPGHDPAVRVILFCRLFQALVFPARCIFSGPVGTAAKEEGAQVSI